MQTTFLTHPQNFRDIQEAISYNELGKATFCRRQNVAKPEVGSQRGEGFLAKRSKNRKQAIKDLTEASLPKLYEVAY
jgi:hypothetical protein